MNKRGIWSLFILAILLLIPIASTSVAAWKPCITDSNCDYDQTCEWSWAGRSCQNLESSTCFHPDSYPGKCSTDADCSTGNFCSGSGYVQLAIDHKCATWNVLQCKPSVCGDGKCTGSEMQSSCPQDCGCPSPSANCDGTWTNGCETINLATSSTDCGSCGNNCWTKADTCGAGGIKYKYYPGTCSGGSCAAQSLGCRDECCPSGQSCKDGSCKPILAPCTDLDGDGFGIGCQNGNDCNDGNSLLTNNCNQCGNSVWEASNGEQCDWGPSGKTDTVNCGSEILTYLSCDKDCKSNTAPICTSKPCNNGKADLGEVCDPTASTATATLPCSGGYPSVTGTCKSDCSGYNAVQQCSRCGDGIVQSPEQCEPGQSRQTSCSIGSQPATQSCSWSCQWSAPICTQVPPTTTSPPTTCPD